MEQVRIVLEFDVEDPELLRNRSAILLFGPDREHDLDDPADCIFKLLLHNRSYQEYGVSLTRTVLENYSDSIQVNAHRAERDAR